MLTPAISLSKSNSATVYICLIRIVGSGILSDSVLPLDPPVKLHPILGTDGNFIFLAAYKTASQLTGGNSGSIKSGKERWLPVKELITGMRFSTLLPTSTLMQISLKIRINRSDIIR